MKQSDKMETILSYRDAERLDQLTRIFTQKQQETKFWRSDFQNLTKNIVVFYQNTIDIFSADIQFDNEQFRAPQSTSIHGNLHTSQFICYFNDLTHEYIIKLKIFKKTFGSIMYDLKRLATNLALIAYCQGFNDVDMIEIIETFSRQYIQTILAIDNTNVRKVNYSDKSDLIADFQCIDWETIDTINELIVLAEQLAIATVHLHCQISLPMIQLTVKSSDQQEKLINEIRLFAMTYVDIVERDYRLFFKYFRNPTALKIVSIPRLLTSIRQEKILIVGGGIGSMATALSFARAGIRVTLVERNRTFNEVGAGMQLAPNCSRILDQLGVLRQVQANAVFPKQIVWMDALTGERLTCIDLGTKFLETFQYPYMVVHRADLLQALYQECLTSGLVTMETDRKVVNIDERIDSMMVQCADGTRYQCKMVIGADGLWSTTRKFVCDDGAPISVGYVTYRGTVGIDQVSEEAGLENVQFWIGPNMHLVQYPIRRGELFNQAAVFKSDRLPDETDQWGTKEELNQRFGIGCQHVKNALNLLQTNFRWPVYELVMFFFK